MSADLQFEHLFDAFGAEQFVRRSLFGAAVPQPDEIRGELPHPVQFVVYHENGEIAFLAKPGKKLSDGSRGVRVDGRRGFVQREQLGFGDQRAGDENALHLSAGEFGETLVGEGLGAD